jgi:hypothetical protein
MADAIKRWTPIEDEEGLGFVGMFSADNGRYVLHSDHLAVIALAVAEEREACIQIISEYQVPVGNSSAGEMACEWTMDALSFIRSAIRARGAA